jgi:predicted transcriptional regulator
MKIQTRRISIRIPDDLHAELIKLSQLIQKHPSQIVRDSVQQSLISYRRVDPCSTS